MSVLTSGFTNRIGLPMILYVGYLIKVKKENGLNIEKLYGLLTNEYWDLVYTSSHIMSHFMFYQSINIH